MLTFLQFECMTEWTLSRRLLKTAHTEVKEEILVFKFKSIYDVNTRNKLPFTFTVVGWRQKCQSLGER